MNDGGPAFPNLCQVKSICRTDETGNTVLEHQNFTTQGMSLWDYFAAAALNGILSGADRIKYKDGGTAPDCDHKSAAEDAAIYAEYMLINREKRFKQGLMCEVVNHGNHPST